MILSSPLKVNETLQEKGIASKEISDKIRIKLQTSFQKPIRVFDQSEIEIRRSQLKERAEKRERDKEEAKRKKTYDDIEK